MKQGFMNPLPRIEDYVRRPTFKSVGPPKQFKQADQVIMRAFRGELGPELQKIGISTPPPHPKDRTVFSPTMVRALLWSGCKAPVFKYRVPVNDPKRMTVHIKEFAKELGADLVGITYLHPAFVFESDRDGKPIRLDHKYAIVIGKEMSYAKIATSPSWYDHFEIGKAYHDMTVLAVHLANYIGQLGYPAQASVMQNDTVLHVPLAVYAGLGEYSRMGRLITREYGPRVRLVTVTTDLPLEVDHPVDFNVEHFCRLCEKCSVNCPGQAIPRGNNKVESRGFLKWHEDSERCYRFWRKNPYQWMACSRCIAVCPWNKPNNILHKMVSSVAIRLAWTHRIILFFDDLFYGKKPKIKKVPASYNEYMMKEDEYLQMAREMKASETLLTKKSMPDGAVE